MKWQRFLIGAGLGLMAGLFINRGNANRSISAEKALKIAKNSFSEQIGKVDGSWIHTIPEDYSKDQLAYKVYKGGISFYQDNDLIQFEFIVDSTTGAILDINEVTSLTKP